MLKKIYIPQISPKMHTSMRLMIQNPPQGYTFITPPNKMRENFIRKVLNSPNIKFLYKLFIKPLINPIYFYNKIYTPQIPEDCDLVFSSGQVLDIKKPWVIEILDHPACMTGYNYDLFIKNKANIEKKLLSSFCKKIIIVNETSLKIMKKHFSNKVIKKIILLRAGIKENNFKKNYVSKKIQIIFMGSIANPDDFYIKGGLEAIEAYNKIKKYFNNVKMIIRCKVPNEIKNKYPETSNFKILSDELSSEDWIKLLKETDICLNLGHIYPLMTILETMSLGIPMVTLDTYAVRDYLDESCAILIKPSSLITGYVSPEYPLNVRSNKFQNEIKKLDPRVINDISFALRDLIVNKNKRERLGNNAKKKISYKFSLEQRNKKLKHIFDSIIF